MTVVRPASVIAALVVIATLALLIFTRGPAGADMTISLSVGRDHTCAVNSSGGVICWGANDSGQIGAGVSGGPDICTNEPSLPGTNDDYPCSKSPMMVSGLSSGVEKVASGGHFTCALKTGGTVACWGRNDVGQLGSGSLGPDDCLMVSDGHVECSTTPVEVSGITDAVDISASSANACALLANGGIKCWGTNHFGELGQGDGNGPEQCGSFDCSKTPVEVAGLKSVAGGDVTVSGLPGVMQMSGGGSNTCVLYTDHTVQCWGWGRAGRIGDGSADDQAHGASNVSGLNDAVQIVTNTSHSCALHEGGTVSCWGDNSFGGLGIGDGMSPDDCGVLDCATTPVIVPGLSGIESLSEGQGGIETCALNGEVKCWGFNMFGQLALGDDFGPEQCGGNDCASTPVVATALPPVESISMGDDHGCAVTQEHGIICWGYNFLGNTGTGTGGNQHFKELIPVQTIGFEGGTPTPTPVPPVNAVWGDLNCSGGVDPIDALAGLRGDAGLSVSQGADCPGLNEMVEVNGLTVPFADVDCSGTFDPIDPLKILRSDAGLSVQQAANCPDIGEGVVLN